MKKMLWTTFLTALFGCGGGGVNVQPYIGLWTSVGNEIETCNSVPHNTSLNGLLTIAQGASPADVVTNAPNGCDLTWSVSGNTASLKGSQTCAVSGSAGGIWTATFTSGSLTLSGNSISYSDQGTGVLNTAPAIQCTFTQAGTFTR